MAQIVVWSKALGKGNTLESKFLGFPVIYISIVYLIVQIIAFTVFTAMPTLPIWSAIVTCAVVLGISAMSMIAGEAGRGEIERVEAKVQQKFFSLRNCKLMWNYLLIEKKMQKLKLRCSNLQKESDSATI